MVYKQSQKFYCIIQFKRKNCLGGLERGKPLKILVVRRLVKISVLQIRYFRTCANIGKLKENRTFVVRCIFWWGFALAKTDGGWIRSARGLRRTRNVFAAFYLQTQTRRRTKQTAFVSPNTINHITAKTKTNRKGWFVFLVVDCLH